MKQKQSLISANFSHFGILGFDGIIAKTYHIQPVIAYAPAITGGPISFHGWDNSSWLAPIFRDDRIAGHAMTVTGSLRTGNPASVMITAFAVFVRKMILAHYSDVLSS